MDHCCEAEISLVCAQGDTLEFLELAEEVFDQMPPFVHFLVDGERAGAARMLGDDDLGAAFVEIGDDGVAIERLVSDASKVNPSMSGGTPTVSKRCPGSSSKRTRLPSASVRARILVVMPPFERPIAWLWVPLLRPVRGGGP
jgi:hypothetical protein